MLNFVLAFVFVAATFALPVTAEPIYLKGAQPVGIAGEQRECFVETVYSRSLSTVRIRSLSADPHEPDELIGLGPVKATFDGKRSGYGYRAAARNAQVQDLFLLIDRSRNAENLSLVILDGHHTDALSCATLSVLEGSELAVVKDMFKHFDDYIEGHDHKGHGHK